MKMDGSDRQIDPDQVGRRSTPNVGEIGAALFDAPAQSRQCAVSCTCGLLAFITSDYLTVLLMTATRVSWRKTARNLKF